MEELIKRTHVYIQHPLFYDIPGCPDNPSHVITWSEYENRLWCFDCEVDFIPKYWGIFDGPIPMGTAKLMGISFDRINIETREIVKHELNIDGHVNEEYNKTWNGWNK